MIGKIFTELYRLKTPLLLLGLWVFYWGWKEAFNTVAFLVGFLALAVIAGHVISKEIFGKYKWDVGERLNLAWNNVNDYALKDAMLAVGMLFARVAIYVAIVIAMALLVQVIFCSPFGRNHGEVGSAHAATIEERAKPLLPILVEEHARIWPESDVAVIASQIQSESAWKEKAKRTEKSGVTSYGLMQVLDVTLAEMQKKHRTLAGTEPVEMLQARWGIRAGILYDLQMWNLCSFAVASTPLSDREGWPRSLRSLSGVEMNRWAFTLAAYNGGYGWIQRDRKLTEERGYNKNAWAGNVENHSSRSKWAFEINRRYPREILANREKWRKVLGG